MSSPEPLSVGPTVYVTGEPAAVRPTPGRGLSGAPVGAVSVEESRETGSSHVLWQRLRGSGRWSQLPPWPLQLYREGEGCECVRGEMVPLGSGHPPEPGRGRLVGA